jgi:hypothetical protein
MFYKLKDILRPILLPPYKLWKNYYLRKNRRQVVRHSINTDDNGFLYIVTGAGYAKECLFSIRSLKQHNNERVCVFSEERYRELFDGECDYFFVIDSTLTRPKVQYISQSPFRNTVYLDSDTFINENISDLFDLLERFDFAGACCNSRKRENYSKLITKYSIIPYSFSEINTGVMAFNDSVTVKDLFEKWQHYYYEYIAKTNGWDQPSFRVALWESDVRICHLPPEYNVRPKSVYEKVRNNKHILGELHMVPRIYHMHYSPRVHKGEFDITELSVLHDKLKQLSTDIKY